MADSDNNNGGWSAVPSGAVPLPVQYSMNDRAIQAAHPNWPTGGTAAQIGIESNGDNNAVSPKGATGVAQMMPSTFDAIAKQLGRKMDIHNVNDQMIAHRYLMLQNLDRTGGDINGSLAMYNSGRTTPDNPETTDYVNKWNQKVGQKNVESPINYNPAQGSADDEGWTKSDAPPGWTPSGPPPSQQSAARGRADAFLNQTKQGIDNSVNAVQGAGEMAANMASGGAGMAAGGLRSLYDIATGNSQNAVQDIENTQKAMTYQPRTPQGQAFAQKLGEGFGAVQGAMEQGAVTALGAIPFIGEDLAKNPTAQEVAKTAADVVANVGPMLMGGEGLKAAKTEKGMPIKDTGAAGELDKLQKLYGEGTPLDQQTYTPTGPFPEGGGPMQGQPNAGPQRPIMVDQAGTATPAGVEPSFEQLAAEEGRRRAEQVNTQAQQQAGDLFPETLGQNEASPFNPNRLATGDFDLTQPGESGVRGELSNRRQGELQLGNDEPLRVSAGGEVFPESFASARDSLQARQAGFDANGQKTITLKDGTPVTLEHSFDDSFGANTHTIRAVDAQGNTVGIASFGGKGTGLEPGVEVEPAFRRKGLATQLYDHADQLGEIPPLESAKAMRTPEGQAFRQARDIMKQRTDALSKTPIEAVDPMSGVSHAVEGSPVERAATPEEFTQALETLAQRDPEKFPMPNDVERAYGQYQNMVSGSIGLDDIAKKYTEAVRDAVRSERVDNHPTVKANQSRVERLSAQLDAARSGLRAGGSSTVALERQLKEATKTLEKSKDNIAKALGVDKDTTLPWERDGTVNMFTFGHLPELMRSLGAILKALHGVVFRTLDKLPKKFSNLDSTGKIFAQGIRDAIAREASKEWPTTVNEQPKQVLNGVPGLREGLKDYLPFEAREDLSPEQLKQAMQQAPDLASGDKTFQGFMRDNFLTGQQLQAFTHHPLVKFAVETMDRAFRNSAQFVRENLTGKDGIRNKVRALTDDEFGSVWQMMQDNEGVREFTPDQMKRAGFNDKQIEVYQKMRQLDKVNLDALNKGRIQAGLKPVEARIAHIAGHFLGDFKRVITDADGKVVAVIAHNLRSAVDTITNRVMEQLGEGHTAGPIEMRKLSEGNQVDRYTGYMNILNDMAERSDVVAKVVDAYREYLTNDGQTAMKYRAAFKSKEGVIGAEGRKSWQSQIANAREGMKNFLKAQEAMHTWANTQEALGKISEFTTDPEISAPNAKAAVQRYLDIVQRRNQGPASDFTNAMINAVAESTGLGPSILRGASSAIKTNLLTMFIGLGKLSHSFVTLIQPLQGIPVVNSLMRAEGAKLGLKQLTAVAKSFASQIEISKALAGGELKGFEKRAMDYAKANDTLNTTQFQFGNLTDINRSRLGANLHKAAEFNVTGMETATRSFTYMYYSHMLRDLGLPEKEIFPAAHNAMRDVMVDYNSWERPGVFGKMGFLGDLTAMLTRYKFNQIDQFSRASKYALNGKLGPMANVMATSMMAAGVRGIMAYTLANSAVSNLTTWAAKNNYMQKPTSIDEMLLHFLHGKNETMANMVKFGLPAGLGINMTGSLSHADDIPNDPLGALVPQATPLAEYAKSAYTYLHDPNSATAKAALYGISPNSARGPLENTMFTDQKGNYFDPKTGELRTRRTTKDMAVRNFGFRPLNEANEALTTSVNKETAVDQGEVKQDIIQRVLKDIDSNGKKVTPELVNKIQSEYSQKYIANNGDPNEIVKAVQEHLGMGQVRTAAERAQGIPKGSLQSILNFQRYQNMK